MSVLLRNAIYLSIKTIKLTDPASIVYLSAIVSHQSNIMKIETPSCRCMCTCMNMRATCLHMLQRFP